MRLFAICVAGLLLTSAVGLAAEPEPVSVTSYWRYWLTHQPPVSSEPYVDKQGQKHTELAIPRGWHVYGVVRSLSTADPPSGWEAADFEDAAWPVERMPVCTGPAESLWDQPLTARRLVGRIRFDVPDPAAVKGLTLTAAFKGGMVVLLNGREVARSHLPAGVLKPDDAAEAYPKGAFLPVEGDDPQAARSLTYVGMWTGAIFWGWRDKPDVKALAAKVRALRDRSLGPVEVPAALLRKGANVLTLDVRAAALPPVAHLWNFYSDEAQSTFWSQMNVDRLRLTADPPASVRPIRRPSGVQLWAEDVHRWVMSVDFLEPGVKVRPVEIVAARNGTFSGQAVVGTTEALTGLKAVASDLTGPGTILASAVRVRYGVPTSLPEMLKNYGQGALRTTFSDETIVRYAESLGLGEELAKTPWDQRLRLAGRMDLKFFDRLSEAPPASVPANSSQTIWLTVHVPKDAAPGVYQGKLTVSAAGAPEQAIPVKVEVTAFTLPAPADWTTFVGIEESPYATAKTFNLPLWSEEHWKRVEACMAWLGALGNRFVQVPLLAASEAGNDDSMVAWVKKANGYEYDWTVLDRYLGLARKHYARPLALVALVHPSVAPKKPLVVTVVDAGAKKALDLPVPGTPEFDALWMPFAKAFVAHVREAKLADSVHWGLFYDEVPPTLRAMAEGLAKAVPDVAWMRSSHEGNRARPFTKESGARVDLDAHIRGFAEPDWSKGGLGRQGWASAKGGDLNLLYPREASQVTAIPAYAPLWHLRELPELTVTSDACGFTRLGANYWDRTAGGWFVPAVLYFLYPGQSGVEGSVQLEILREGLQECEARIALERRDPGSVVLLERTTCAWLLPGGTSHGRIGEFHGNWQDRSRRLFGAAKE